MKIKVLGCDGGIGGKRRTTCLAVDDDILIDAGTGIIDLSLAALAKIDHIFLTHAHLDHILGIALMADSVYSQRTQAITVYALAETIAHLRRHIFNWQIWPDFSVLPSIEAPVLQFRAIQAGHSVLLGNRKITALPVNHTLPAVGYALDSGNAGLAFSGDTTTCPAFWASLNGLPNLKHLIIETSFANNELALARISKHFCPSLLADDLKFLESQPQIHITHLKPDAEVLILHELTQTLGRAFRRLQADDVIVL